MKLVKHYKELGMRHETAVQHAIKDTRVNFLFDKYKKLGFDDNEAQKLAEKEYDNLPDNQKYI